MKPSAPQILQALQNHHRPAWTPGAKIQGVLRQIRTRINDKPSSVPSLSCLVWVRHGKAMQ